jgi:phosphatidylethanolamine/phosphatidyl-N-methylethanolamine N-methyltransferase
MLGSVPASNCRCSTAAPGLSASISPSRCCGALVCAFVAPYFLTVVPDPAATLDELLRVVKPGGEIVLVNHVGAERGPVAAIEAWLGRRSASLGWRPQFPWSIISGWIAAQDCARLVERRLIAPLGLFTLARILRTA